MTARGADTGYRVGVAVGSCPPSLRCDRAAADRLDHERAVTVNAAGPMAVSWARAASGSSGPDVLAWASYVLPQVSFGLVLAGDVHAALFEALSRLGLGTDRYHRLRLADEARDMLAAHLVTAGQAVPAGPVSATMRGWLAFQDLPAVCRELVDAAGFWRRQLDPFADRPSREGG